MLDFGYESIAGLALGAALALYVWKTNDKSKNNNKKTNRTFNIDELALYNGKGQRLCFIAIKGQVFDVTCDKHLYAPGGKYHHMAGKNNVDLDPKDFETKYVKKGTLILPKAMTLNQLKEFDGKNGKPVYLAAKGKIYDVTPGKNFYGPDGPYGFMAGNDASRALALMSLEKADVENPTLEGLSPDELNTLNEWIGKFDLKYNVVGYVVDDSGKRQYPGNSDDQMEPLAAPAPAPIFLNKKRQQVQLTEKVELTHDTRLFRFALPTKDTVFGLPVGKHIKIWCPNPKPVTVGMWNSLEDKEAAKVEIERKYTPSSSDDEVGYFDLVIKVYNGGQVERFPDGGKMSQYLDQVKIGEYIDIAGPYGLIEYKGKGLFSIKRKDRQVKRVGMLAGGTGITPMLQLITAVLKDPKDETEVSLLFANQTEGDILVRDMLEKLAKEHPQRFKLWYTLDRPSEGWEYSTGFIDEKMIKEHMPPPGDDTIILMCGPPPMIKFACKANLDKLNYAKESQIEF